MAKEKKCCGKCNCGSVKVSKELYYDEEEVEEEDIDDEEEVEEEDIDDEEEVEEDDILEEDDLDEYIKDRKPRLRFDNNLVNRELKDTLTRCIDLRDIGFFKDSVWMTTSQAACWYSVDPRTVRRWIENDEIEAVDAGNGFQTKWIVKVDISSKLFYTSKGNVY